MNYKKMIIERIESFPREKVFITNDFLDIAKYETAKSTLNRLYKDGVIMRIHNGFYYKPNYIEIIDEYEEPTTEEISKAIARKYNWQIAPTGNTALNILGLSTQVPAKNVYISNGRYINFRINNMDIEFKRVASKYICNMTTLTSIVIQAIKQLGKDKISNEQIAYLRNKLTDSNKRDLIEGGRNTSKWIYDIIKEISLDVANV